jgi:RNA polymerase sigma factor (sigma-70 family)
MTTSKEILELVNNIKVNNCELSLECLIEKTQKLVYKIYYRYGPALIGAGVSLEDLFQEVPTLIYQAVLKFNPNRKVKFTTYLTQFSRWECLNLISIPRPDSMESEEITEILNEQSKDSYFSSDSNFSSHNEKDVAYVLECLEGVQDKRLLEVCKLRFFSNQDGKPLAWRKVGKAVGLSGQGTSDLWRKGTRFLRAKLMALNT